MQFRSVVFSLQESEIRELRAQARGIVAKQREAESGVVRTCSITQHHGMYSAKMASPFAIATCDVRC